MSFVSWTSGMRKWGYPRTTDKGCWLRRQGVSSFELWIASRERVPQDLCEGGKTKCPTVALGYRPVIAETHPQGSERVERSQSPSTGICCYRLMEGHNRE